MNATLDIPPGRMPWGLIGMLGLVLAAESWVASHPLELTGNPVLLNWRTTGRAATGEEVRRSEVLCFGDSLVKHGIYPRLLEASLGRPAFNLALPAGPAPASYFLLRRALDAGARPRALVVDFHPGLLLSRPSQAIDYWPELVTTRELVELSCVARDFRLFAVMALAKALPTVKDRHAIRARVLGSLRGQAWQGAALYPALLRNWRVNRGALVPPAGAPQAVVGARDTDAEGSAPATRTAWWEIDRATTVYVRRFLDLADARGLPVFWLLPPTSPAHLARSERNGRDARYAAFVRETQARYANVVVIDGRRAGYRGEVFSDKTHLDRRGASTFSEAVATLIGPCLARDRPAPASRWIDLPPYRAPTGEIPLEDLEQSSMALRASGDRSRR